MPEAQRTQDIEFIIQIILMAEIKQTNKQTNKQDVLVYLIFIQSVSSSLAKHGGALFSVVSWSIKDPIGAPGPYEPQEC